MTTIRKPLTKAHATLLDNAATLLSMYVAPVPMCGADRECPVCSGRGEHVRECWLVCVVERLRRASITSSIALKKKERRK
jgi:hypothetical protein